MTIQDFIQKAKDGGFEIHHSLTSGWLSEGLPAPQCVIFSLVLNPKVWQAVGKVEGWGLVPDAVHALAYSMGKDIPNQKWLWNMHRMIDALAEGKTIEEFIATL